MANIIQMMKDLGTAFFNGDDMAELLGSACDNIYICGFADNRIIDGIDQAKELWNQNPYQKYEGSTLSFGEEKMLSEHSGVLEFDLEYKNIHVGYRVTGVSEPTPAGEKVSSLHISAREPVKLRQMIEYRAKEAREQLLNDTTAGGMMGGYIEPGFPFYFINKRMLTYLGYESEGEFVDDIQGLIDNCMHPEDRQRVGVETIRGIEQRGEYQVEYRMRKKDGSYIWVHDVGRKMIAEDGREAITSVCYDITKEKEHAQLLNSLIHNANGGIALYRVEEDWRMTPIFASEGVGAISNRDEEEYMELCQDDAIKSIYEEDQASVLDAIREAIMNDEVTTLTYRVPDNGDGYLWINGMFSKFGEDNGRPVMRGVFTPASVQYDLQLTALSTDTVGVYVADADTDELYYANDASFVLHGVKRCQIAGKTCHEVFRDCTGRCDDCWQNSVQAANGKIINTTLSSGRILSVTTQRKVWNQKNVFVVMLTDVTEQMHMKGQLEKANERFETLLNNAECGIAIYRRTKEVPFAIRYLNEGFCQMCGTSREQLMLENESGYNPCVAKESQEEVITAFRQACKTFEPVEVTYRMVNHKGMEMWNTLRMKAVPVDSDTIDVYATYFDVTHQIRMRNEIQQSQEMLERACDFAGMWNWLYDIPNDRIFPGKRLQRDFDMPEVLNDFPESWLGMGFIMPESVQLHRERVWAIKEGSPKEEFVCKIQHKDKSIHWTRIRFNRMSGNPDHAICTAQLIDTEKYLESRIELEEKQQMEGKPNLLAHFVTNLSKNKPLKHVYHYEERKPLLEWNSLKDQVARTEEYVIDQADRDTFVKIHDTGYLLEQFVQGNREEFLEYRRNFPDGRIIWVRSVIHMLQEPTTGDILNYEYLYDIHHYKTNEELMGAVVDFGFEICASLIVNSDQITVLYSRRQHGEDNLVVSQFSELNRKYAEKILEEDREEYLRESSIDNIKKRLRDRDHFETMHRIMEDGIIHYKKDQCYGYSEDRSTCLLIRSDVTELIKSEEQKRTELKKALEVAEKADMAKTEFLARMSHEIRTPMNAIMGMVSIAKDNKADLQQIFDCINKIDTSSHFLLNLINDILEMSRIESGKIDVSRSEFDYLVLMENIRTIIEPLALNSEINYQYVSEPIADTHYRGDMMRIQQILVNILTNAVKFTKPDGRIRFTAKIIRETSSQSVFQFVIADTGIGMSPEFMQHMFEPFVQENIGNTSKYGGTGLGLAISKNLVEAMGGSITADSFEGLGSTFTIEIPLERVSYHVEEKHHTREVKTGNQQELLKDYQILMAEDHPLNTMVAKKLLESRGAIVTAAENGQIAVDKFKDSPPEFFDAILMDILMPVMDGLDATRTIRKLDRADALTIPIIAMTANALDEDRRKTKEAGMNAHLSKPFEPAQLYQTLLKQIGGE